MLHYESWGYAIEREEPSWRKVFNIVLHSIEGSLEESNTVEEVFNRFLQTSKVHHYIGGNEQIEQQIPINTKAQGNIPLSFGDHLNTKEEKNKGEKIKEPCFTQNIKLNDQTMLSQCQEDTSRCKEQVEEMSFEGDEEMEMAIEEGISP